MYDVIYIQGIETMSIRKKTVILGAVILALIMVVPASYIIFSGMNSHKALPVIYTSNSESAQNWTLNFYGEENQTSGENPFHLVNESASFVQPGYNQSFLNLSMPFIHEYPNGGPTGNALTFALPFVVTGSVMASALPTGVMISYNSSLPPGPDSPLPNYMLPYVWTGGMPSTTDVNVSNFDYWSGSGHVVQLVNQSHYNGREAYRFSFFDGAMPEFYGIKPNHPFNFDLNFTLLGLSRPVYENIEFNFMDVNSTGANNIPASPDMHSGNFFSANQLMGSKLPHGEKIANNQILSLSGSASCRWAQPVPNLKHSFCLYW